MSDSLTLALRRATVATFEKLAMIVADEPPAIVGVAAFDEIGRAGIELTGGTRGYFELFVTRSLLPEVAEGMLGTAEVDRAVEDDVLGELANVISGNLLSVLDAARTTRLSPPTFEDRVLTRPPAARALFTVDRSIIEARLYLEPQV